MIAPHLATTVTIGETMEKNRTIKITNDDLVRISNKKTYITWLTMFSMFFLIFLPMAIGMDWSWILLILPNLIGIVWSILAMPTNITIDTDNKVITNKKMFKTQSLAFDEISSITVRKTLLGKQICLMDSNGRAFAKILFSSAKECYIVPENLLEYFTSRQFDKTLLAPNEKLKRNVALNSKVPFAVISALQLGLILFMYICMLVDSPTYPIVEIKFYRYGIFWLALIWTALIPLGLLVKSPKCYFTDIIAAVMFIVFLPSFFICGLAVPEAYCVSSTQDFANYQQVFDEEMGGDYQHFPQQVDGEVVTFSYYYENYWDSVHELYLEVNYDKQTFEEIYNTYQDKHACYFDNSLEEVDLCEAHLKTTKSNGTLKISSAWIEKIIFDKQNNTIIYYYLSSSDFLELEWCQLAKRFDIDFEQYEQYLEQLNEKSKV